MTDIQQIQSIRSQTLAQLDSIRANPKPTYWIDGQRVHWQEYVMPFAVEHLITIPLLLRPISGTAIRPPHRVLGSVSPRSCPSLVLQHCSLSAAWPLF